MTGYTRATLGALVDALVPETPALASTHGPEHVPGGIEAGADRVLTNALNHYRAVYGPLGHLLDTYPYALAVSLLLDAAACELLVRRANEDRVRPQAGLSTRGPYTLLSRRDRLQCLRLLEADGVAHRLEDVLGPRGPDPGALSFLVQGLHTIVLMAAYSDWGVDEPSPETVQGWRQTGYPGPADGYPAFRGYEVEVFEEDAY